jgi:hypothetical protein
VFLDSAAGQQAGSRLWLSHADVQALLTLLLPDVVYGQLKERLNYAGPMPANPAKSVMAKLQKDRGSLPYFQCTLQDSPDAEAGVQVC